MQTVRSCRSLLRGLFPQQGIKQESQPHHLWNTKPAQGFTLIEMLVAMSMLCFGLLAVGQMIYVAMGSSSLSRSKGSAAIAAQNKLETLAHCFRQNVAHADIAIGTHGPEPVQYLNADGSVQNRYSVAWIVSPVPDPRSNVTLNARMVLVTVTPIGSNATNNEKAFFNKVVQLIGVLTPGY